MLLRQQIFQEIDWPLAVAEALAALNGVKYEPRVQIDLPRRGKKVEKNTRQQFRKYMGSSMDMFWSSPRIRRRLLWCEFLGDIGDFESRKKWRNEEFKYLMQYLKNEV